MLVDIYSSNMHFGKHLTVPAGTEEEKLPTWVDPGFGSLKLVNARLEIVAGVPNGALDAVDVISQIKAKGYAFHAYRRAQKSA
jgi:hypothetical protein